MKILLTGGTGPLVGIILLSCWECPGTSLLTVSTATAITREFLSDPVARFHAVGRGSMAKQPDIDAKSLTLPANRSPISAGRQSKRGACSRWDITRQPTGRVYLKPAKTHLRADWWFRYQLWRSRGEVVVTEEELPHNDLSRTLRPAGSKSPVGAKRSHARVPVAHRRHVRRAADPGQNDASLLGPRLHRRRSSVSGVDPYR